MNWADVAPLDIAIRQLAWERRQLVLRMIHLDFTLHEIGKRLSVSKARVGVLARRAKGQDKKARCPIIVWSDERNAIRDMIRASE